MKKFIAMMLCIVLVLSLVACGKDAEEPTETTTEPTTETTEAPTTESPTTEEVTEEITEEEYIEPVTDEYGLDAETRELLENPVFDFITIDDEGMWQPTEATELMLSMQELLLTLPIHLRFASYIVQDVVHAEYKNEVYFDYSEGFEVVSGMSPVSFQPQFVYLINAPEGTDIEALCAQIEANADPHRTQCPPFVENIVTASSGNTIMFAMCQTPEAANALVEGFNSLMAE